MISRLEGVVGEIQKKSLHKGKLNKSSYFRYPAFEGS